MNQAIPTPSGFSRRPLRVLDLMVLVVAVAVTLISPGIMKAIIPAESYHNWDRRQYVAHLTALVMIWWTVALLPLVLAEGRSRLQHACRNYGVAACLAAMLAVVLLFARQVPIVLVMTGPHRACDSGDWRDEPDGVVLSPPLRCHGARAYCLGGGGPRGFVATGTYRDGQSAVELVRAALWAGRLSLDPAGPACGAAGLVRADSMADDQRHPLVTVAERPAV